MDGRFLDSVFHRLDMLRLMPQPTVGARAPWPGVVPARRRIMAANRRRDTGPELRLRSLLHGLGFRFRVDFPIPVSGRRPVRPDIAFTRYRLAVFVDGCFWHGCPVHWSPPKTNRQYWTTKIARNRRRDRRTDELLDEVGWNVLRAWEHDPPDQVAALVVETLGLLSAQEKNRSA